MHGSASPPAPARAPVTSIPSPTPPPSSTSNTCTTHTPAQHLIRQLHHLLHLDASTTLRVYRYLSRISAWLPLISPSAPDPPPIPATTSFSNTYSSMPAPLSPPIPVTTCPAPNPPPDPPIHPLSPPQCTSSISAPINHCLSPHFYTSPCVSYPGTHRS
ncbi:hypothetical protein CEXT_766331 [Caerostris extrusa]|uniref:Uncharacterized protein n=1 Tax=Caerostris extrusa TaxID=172846 RepID=A0AAV4UDU0_CAEEX|nr:hypothetical protein CEXT_766331 [Caerostris extrusa]